MVEYYVEKTKSNRSHCNQCKKVIPKDEKRVVSVYNGFGFRMERFYCKGCGLEMIDNEITALEERKILLLKSDL